MEQHVVRLEALRHTHLHLARILAGRSAYETLQAVVEGIVDGVGFGVAAANVVQADGSFETVAVAGSNDAREELLGRRYPSERFQGEFDRAEAWGSLRFVPHDRYPDGEHPPSWVPELEVSDRPDAWHPLDALFAPLVAPSGRTVGIVSVDIPVDGRRPGPLQRQLLEIFAAQAGIAVHNVMLTAELEREHERLRASEESFRLAFENAGVGMSTVSLAGPDEGRILRVNEALCQVTGRPPEELVGRTGEAFVHPEDRASLTAVFALLAAGDRAVQRIDVRHLRPDGDEVWVAITASAVLDSGGHPMYAVCQTEDVTARRAADEELSRRALHDPLTGLPNRAALRDRIGTAIDRARRSVRPGALLFCDLDEFKRVNDMHGHHAGDEVLCTVGRRLVDQVRSVDVVARLGGDEFVVLAEDLTSREASVLAERVVAAVARPFDVVGQQIQLSVSVGVAELTAGTQDVDALLRAADRAMYVAKDRRGGYAFAGERSSPVFGEPQ